MLACLLALLLVDAGHVCGLSIRFLDAPPVQGDGNVVNIEVDHVCHGSLTCESCLDHIVDVGEGLLAPPGNADVEIRRIVHCLAIYGSRCEISGGESLGLNFIFNGEMPPINESFVSSVADEVTNVFTPRAPSPVDTTKDTINIVLRDFCSCQIACSLCEPDTVYPGAVGSLACYGMAPVGATCEITACPVGTQRDGLPRRCVWHGGDRPLFDGVGHTCLDIDECALNLAHCPLHSSCENLEGAYNCPCDPGYYRLGDPLPDSLPTSPGGGSSDGDHGGGHRSSMDVDAPVLSGEPFKGSFDICEDIDECKVYRPCHAVSRCMNTPGSFTCECNPNRGFLGDGLIECEALPGVRISMIVVGQMAYFDLESNLFKHLRVLLDIPATKGGFGVVEYRTENPRQGTLWIVFHKYHHEASAKSTKLYNMVLNEAQKLEAYGLVILYLEVPGHAAIDRRAGGPIGFEGVVVVALTSCCGLFLCLFLLRKLRNESKEERRVDPPREGKAGGTIYHVEHTPAPDRNVSDSSEGFPAISALPPRRSQHEEEDGVEVELLHVENREKNSSEESSYTLEECLHTDADAGV